MRPSTSKFLRRLRYAVPAFLAAVGLGLIVWHFLTREPPVERLQRQIRQEVPLGTTRAEVEAWALRRLGRMAEHQTTPPEESRGRTLEETAGVSWRDLRSVESVTVPLGSYTVNGQAGPNHLWVFFTLNDADEVADYHFLTLEQLAHIEQERAKKAAP